MRAIKIRPGHVIPDAVDMPRRVRAIDRDGGMLVVWFDGLSSAMLLMPNDTVPVFTHAVVVNEPGYLPNTEPDYFESFEDARAYLVDLLFDPACPEVCECGECGEIRRLDALAAGEVSDWCEPGCIAVNGWAFEIQELAR